MRKIIVSILTDISVKERCYLLTVTATDKRVDQVNMFLISGYSLEAPHMFLYRNKKSICTFWLKEAPNLELCCSKISELQISLTYITFNLDLYV